MSSSQGSTSLRVHNEHRTVLLRESAAYSIKKTCGTRGFRCNLICKETTKFYCIKLKKNSKRYASLFVTVCMNKLNPGICIFHLAFNSSAGGLIYLSEHCICQCRTTVPSCWQAKCISSPNQENWFTTLWISGADILIWQKIFHYHWVKRGGKCHFLTDTIHCVYILTYYCVGL
jgi:hypothetical protein